MQKLKITAVVVACCFPPAIFAQPMAAYSPPPTHKLDEASKMPAKPSVLPEQPKPLFQTVTGGFSVNNDSREQVRDFYNAIYPTSENIPILSTGDVTNCFPGTNSPYFMEGVLRRINWFRAMAGEPASVVFNDTYNSNAQAVAVMISASGLLNHDPPTNWPCYSSAGAAGAGGNQAGGDNGADAITLYIWDFGDGNNDVGHRRWILYPSEQIMGTGDLPASGTNIAANSTFVFDSSINDPRPATRQPYVSWPPEGYVPYQLAFPYWSFAISNADFTNATVEMSSNGSPVSVAIQPYATGYGENTIVWVPDGLDANCECTTFPFSGTDTVYSVNVSNIVLQGGATTNYTYNVTLFDPSVPGTDYVATAVSGPPSPTVGASNNYSCVPLANTNVTGYMWLVAQLTNGNIVEIANADSVSNELMYFTFSPAPADYSIITNAPDGSTNMCLHLCHDGPTNNPESQFFTLNETLYPTTNTTVNFLSLLAYASPDETARVQVSTDGGNTWQDLYVQAGLPDDEQPVETSFTLRTVSLASVAGKETMLRFNYAFTGGEYWPYSDPDTGWDIESIQITNALQLVSQTTNSTLSTNFTFTPSQAGAYALYAEPVLFSQFPVSGGPPYQVTAVAPSGIMMNDPVAAGNSVQLNFTVTGGLSGSYLLLQTTNAAGAWTTNTAATFTTNAPGTSYRFTASTGARMMFYQVKLAP